MKKEEEEDAKHKSPHGCIISQITSPSSPPVHMKNIKFNLFAISPWSKALINEAFR